MLSEAVIRTILDTAPILKIGVLGDLFLDRYLDIDAGLTERSIETGLDAFQVIAVRSLPGAAGTVINNLAALGVGSIVPIAVIGDDGEGYELLQSLANEPAVERQAIIQDSRRRTPTYTKPMLHQAGSLPKELNRLDIKNRKPTPRDIEDRVLAQLADVWHTLDALLVLDQVSEEDCGVVTARVRGELAEFGGTDKERLILADSRERIGMFRNVTVKPNWQECLRAAGDAENSGMDVPTAVLRLVERTGRPVFCTMGTEGMLLASPGQKIAFAIPAYPVHGEVDIVGAGDSCSAAVACALANKTSLQQAAAFGNLVASITIQQIGTTGAATPELVWQRWDEVENHKIC